MEGELRLGRRTSEATGAYLVRQRLTSREHSPVRQHAVPDGYSVDEAEDPTSVAEIDPEHTALGDQSQRFWTEFLDNYLKLDDPEQPKPNPARLGYISFPLPARASWLTVYRAYTVARLAFFFRVGRTPLALTPCGQSWMNGKRGVRSRTS